MDIIWVESRIYRFLVEWIIYNYFVWNYWWYGNNNTNKDVYGWSDILKLIMYALIYMEKSK